MKDLYKILGIDKQASQPEVKAAYRKLAMKYHPDKNPGDATAEEKFKEVNEAYATLGDSQKRSEYDSPKSFFHGHDDMFSHMSGIFSDLFGNRQSAGHHRRHSNPGIEVEITISFLDSVLGTQKRVELVRQASCGPCGGTGSRPGTSPETCGTCHGRGKVMAKHSFIQIATTCPTCEGTGKLVMNACLSCAGAGMKDDIKNITVDIPAGIESGEGIRIPQVGHDVHPGSPPGDLIIFINVSGSSEFQRDGDNIYSGKKISLKAAVLGGEISVKTIHGSTKIKINPGTQPGSRIRIPGQGVTNSSRGTVGDHILTVNVSIPQDLTSEQYESFRTFCKDLS